MYQIFIAFYFDKYIVGCVHFCFNVYPLKKYLILAIISIFVSALASITPLSVTITGLIYFLMDDIMIPIMFYILYLDDKTIIRKFITTSMVVFSVAALYGITEYVTGTNYFFDYIKENVNREYLVGKFYLGGERLGMIRINSLFSSPNLFVYGAFISSLCVAYNQHFRDSIKFTLPFTLLTFFVILIANSRTVLIASLVVAIPLFLLSKYRSKYIFFIGLLLIIELPFFSQYAANITSVFSFNGQNDIAGSSVTQRLEQLDASFMLFEKHPINGNGYQSLKYFLDSSGNGMVAELGGAESIWFQLLIERGVFGILVYLYLFYCMFFVLGGWRNVFFLFYCFGYIVGNTMSSLPGFSMGWLYLTIVIYYSMINKSTVPQKMTNRSLEQLKCKRPYSSSGRFWFR